jgi:hypothetical protein
MQPNDYGFSDSMKVREKINMAVGSGPDAIVTLIVPG